LVSFAALINIDKTVSSKSLVFLDLIKYMGA